jgi:hypothetical protein
MDTTPEDIRSNVLVHAVSSADTLPAASAIAASAANSDPILIVNLIIASVAVKGLGPRLSVPYFNR